MFEVKQPRKDGGLKQVLKGKSAPCHPDKIIWARGMCKNCYSKWLKKNNPEYSKRQSKNHERWVKKYKEKNKKNHRLWRMKQDPSYNRIRLLKRYGMTIDDFNDILKKQGGVCAICENSPKNGRHLHVDHDHDTGIVRGLLCFRCNFGLSYFDGNKKIIENLHKYITVSYDNYQRVN